MLISTEHPVQKFCFLKNQKNTQFFKTNLKLKNVNQPNQTRILHKKFVLQKN